MNIFNDLKNLEYQETQVNLRLEPFDAFKRIYSHFDNCFFLESLGSEGLHARFAYIGIDPIKHIAASGDKLVVDGNTHTSKNPYKALCSLSSVHVKGLNGNGFTGGLAGYFAHGATVYFEEAFVGHEDHFFPDFEFGLYLDGFSFDRLSKKTVYFTLGKNRVSTFLPLFKNKMKKTSFSYELFGRNKSKHEYKDMVSLAKEHIAKGNIFQVVLSVKSNYGISGDPIRVYESLRCINPSPNMFFFKFGNRVVMGASPELLIRVDGKRATHLGTLAGTIKRGKDDQEDALFSRKLLSDEKEKAEHLMLVDLARNDMGRICRFGSIVTEKILQVKRFSHVQHLSSEIYGTLRDGKNSFSALSACFPAGTLTGAPKVEAMKIIAQLEAEARGPYGGVCGYFSFNGNAMFCINIRSLAIANDVATAQVGSGIVYDSIAANEYQEIVNKGKAMELALQNAKFKGKN